MMLFIVSYIFILLSFSTAAVFSTAVSAVTVSVTAVSAYTASWVEFELSFF